MNFSAYSPLKNNKTHKHSFTRIGILIHCNILLYNQVQTILWWHVHPSTAGILHMKLNSSKTTMRENIVSCLMSSPVMLFSNFLISARVLHHLTSSIDTSEYIVAAAQHLLLTHYFMMGNLHHCFKHILWIVVVRISMKVFNHLCLTFVNWPRLIYISSFPPNQDIVKSPTKIIFLRDFHKTWRQAKKWRNVTKV